MKRAIFSFWLLFLFAISLYSGEKGSVSLTVSPLMPADANFKDIYGNSVFFPEIKAKYKIFKDFFLWAGYGFLTKKGTTQGIKLETESVQHYFSVGAGFISKIGGRLDYKAECGLFLINYRERAMEETRTESDNGIRFDVGVVYNINKRFFSEASLGYLTAVDDVDTKSLKLGGFRILIGFGVNF